MQIGTPTRTVRIQSCRTFQLKNTCAVYGQSTLTSFPSSLHPFLERMICLPLVRPPLLLDLCRLTSNLEEVKGRWPGEVLPLRHNQILPTHLDWQLMFPWHNPL